VQEILWVISTINPSALLDITIVALLFFVITFFFRGTQAVALLRGIVITFVSLFIVATVLQLQALSWLLTNALTALVIAIPVIFQPELRRMLEQLGRGSFLFTNRTPDDVREHIVNEIVKAAEKLAQRQHGALIVIQRDSMLDEFISTGVPMNSQVRAEILLTIFWPKTELHDGAVIINQEGKIASAAAVLPLSASRNLPNPKMGTRHRASLGISEVSDAICVVISEETGRISVTNGGHMVSKIDLERLRAVLMALYGEAIPSRRATLRQQLGNLWRFVRNRPNTVKGSS
jgi:diadenylate cyclase